MNPVIFFLNIFDYLNKKKIINFFKKEINRKINVFFDIGAHNGETFFLFDKKFTIENFYSFEASPQNFDNLKKKQKKDNWHIYNLALGDKNEKKIFYQLSESSSSGFNDLNKDSNYFKKKNFLLNLFSNNRIILNFNLEISTLNDFLIKNKIKKIDILKIDTEGYEFQILKGLKDQIKNIEFVYFGHHYDDMINKNY